MDRFEKVTAAFILYTAIFLLFLQLPGNALGEFAILYAGSVALAHIGYVAFMIYDMTQRDVSDAAVLLGGGIVIMTSILGAVLYTLARRKDKLGKIF